MQEGSAPEQHGLGLSDTSPDPVGVQSFESSSWVAVWSCRIFRALAWSIEAKNMKMINLTILIKLEHQCFTVFIDSSEKKTLIKMGN